MLESRIARSGDRFLLEVNGERIPLMGYMSYQPEAADYAGFREAGVRLLFTGVYAGDRGINPTSGIRPFRPGFWRGEDAFDFSAADADFRRLAGGAAPGEVFIIPRLMLEPPSWWEERHPDELCRDASGASAHQSYASRVWLRDTERVMGRFQRWLEESGWDRYVAGWHLACGSTEEFLRPITHEMQYADFSAPARRAYGAWLEAKYGEIAALNAAWNTRYAAFSDVPPASPASRRYAANGWRRDEARERPVIDYYRFHSETVANALIALCEAGKRATGGRQVMGAFYGYLVNCQSPELGTHAVEPVLASDAVDFLACPFVYAGNRPLGEDWPLPGMVDSARLHGKPWFQECDVRTCASRPISECMPAANPVGNRRYDGPVWFGPADEAGSLGQMGKAFARVLTGGLALWWFDMWGGWYRREAFMAFHRRARQIYEAEALAGRDRQAAQIAVFADGDAYARVATDCPLTEDMLEGFLLKLGRAGAPYHQYLQDDLARVDPGDYRAAMFPAATVWTDARAAALAAWRSGGRALVFAGCDAPPEGAIRLEAHNAWARVTDECVEYFCADAAPTTALLREAALMAGAHVYAFTDDVVYASARYVAIHAASPGEKRLYLPKKGRLRDAFTGETLEGCDHFADFSMAFGETRLFETLYPPVPAAPTAEAEENRGVTSD